MQRWESTGQTQSILFAVLERNHKPAMGNTAGMVSELREHFAQFGHVRKCIVPFDKDTGFHRGMGWIQFSSEEELQNALQQENHVIDGVKLHVQAQRPKVLQGDQTSDEEKDF
uniref:SRA stem-loop interacting RNA binding protein n=1 Tax=Equus caballus TaxID=9796 RepID=F7C6N9_HORSE